jgi:hypothetical protein
MRRVICAAVLLAVASTATAAPAGAAKRKAPVRAKHAQLKAFASCPDLVAYGRRYAARPGVANGVPPRAVPQVPVPLGAVRRSTANGEIAPTATAAPLAAGDTATDSFSGTNVQELGVDEPDVVKTDGRRVFVLAGSKLLAYDVTADTPKLLGSLTLAGSPQDLLLRGDRVLALGAAAAPGGIVPVNDVAAGAPVATLLPYPVPSQAQLTEVSVKDPAAMTVSRTLTVDGQYVSARLTGGTARVILNSPPSLTPLATSAPATGVAQPARAAAARLGLRAFVPETVIRSNISRRTFRRPLVGCGAVSRPGAYSGLDLLTVMTIDLDRGLYSVDRDAVIAGAQVVYASAASIYIASQRYVPSLDTPADVPARMTTEIHRFDASDPDRTTYRSSGSVPGFVLNQFALSEDKGVLRVATTEDPLWMNGAQQQESQSGVSVLRERGGALETVGRIGGLGKGERIYAVRFIGDRGYLVTFRQVDPLFTLDLSDPARPRQAGELKVAGYSAYLHPVGDGLLLGVGQDASDAGVRQGPQVSLFDVSDPAAPKRLAQRVLGDQGASTAAEWDHHAFLWWAPEKLAVLPLQQYGATTVSPGLPVPTTAAPAGPAATTAAATEPFAGAIGLHVQRSGITEAGRVSHGDPYTAVVRRSLVAQGRLFTISDRGIAASRLSDLGQLGFTAFPAD